MKQVLVLILFISFISCNKSPESIFTGNTFQMQFQPMDINSDEAKFMADYMNENNFKVQFVTDSTYVMSSVNNLVTEPWHIDGDSIALGSSLFALKSVDPVILYKSDQVIKLVKID